MSLFEVILLILIVVIGALVFISFDHLKRQQTTQEPLVEWLKSTMVALQQSDKNVTDTLQKSYESMNQRLDAAARVIGELKNETGKFAEIGRSMQSLQDFLNSPKLRGNVGEQILTDLMSQVLPADTFQTQYRFRNGDIVDAVIKTKAGLIPIDSKFPMENFTKLRQAETKKAQDAVAKTFVADVKKHIKAIATKYIRSDENTVDFALMYVPAESVYYEITANQPELSQFSQDNRVLLVSPSTFYAFLRTILVSFEGQRLAKEVHTILNQLRTIQKDAAQFGDKLNLVSKHLTNAYNNMNAVTAEFNQLQTKIDFTNALSASNDIPKIE